jgi:uncharacterized phiE125 gp8 family phage protein
MNIRRISSESGLPVALEALKQDLRIDDDDFDATLERMSATAAGLIERRSGYVLVPGLFEALVDTFGDWNLGAWSITRTPLAFRRAPFRELVSVEAMTAANIWTAQELDDFQVIERERDFQLTPFASFQAPCPYATSSGVRVRFRAGFDLEDRATGDSPESGDGGFPVDPTIRGVFIALVGHYYQNRELFGADKLTEIESTAGGLLNSIRTFW